LIVAVLPGNSGGPVLNEEGQLLGIATAGFIVFYGTTHLNVMQSLDAIIGFGWIW
jgi:S1-C subfamily serine protease